MIVNNRTDFAALSQADQAKFKTRLAASIYGWEWQDGEWVQKISTSTIERFGFGLDDFPDAPMPEQHTNNPDEDAKAQELAEAKRSRGVAYTQEADPLFFKYQRGEATKQEWLDKIEEIRESFPYPISN